MDIDQWLAEGAKAQETPQQSEPQIEQEVEDSVDEVDQTDDDSYSPDLEDEEQYEDSVEDEPVQETQSEQKKAQTKEENARYAEMRRQQQIDKAVEERLRQSKEYQTTQLIAEMYGVPEDQLYDKLYEAKLTKEAKDKNVPVEYLREREELRRQQQQLQEQMQNLMFQQWQGRIDSEKAQLKQQFANLTDEDLEGAAYYMLDTLGRTDIPLRQAVFALHGEKLLGNLKNTAKNEALAEMSGRKKSPLPTKNGSKGNEIVKLSDEERFVAKKLGLTDKEYSKWKEGN